MKLFGCQGVGRDFRSIDFMGRCLQNYILNDESEQILTEMKKKKIFIILKNTLTARR